ncbi:unnamed protein product [Camellia sinensis]
MGRKPNSLIQIPDAVDWLDLQFGQTVFSCALYQMLRCGGSYIYSSCFYRWCHLQQTKYLVITVKMADFVSSLDNPPMISAASSSGATVADHEDDFKDACSICLEPFNSQDPPTVTKKQRVPYTLAASCLEGPFQLLAAVENERNLRSRRNARHEDYEMNIDNSYGDYSDFGECIMRHFAAAARRARYVERRGRPRSSGIGPPLVLLSVPPGDLPLPDVQHMRTTSPEECQTSSYEFSEGDSPTFSTLRSVVPEVVNVEPNFVSNRDGCNKPCSFAALKVHKDQAPLNFLPSRSLLNRNFLWLLPDIRNQSQKVPEDLKRSYLPTISKSKNWEEEFNVRGMQSPNENAGESVHDMSSPESPRVHSTFPSELDISLVQVWKVMLLRREPVLNYGFHISFSP